MPDFSDIEIQVNRDEVLFSIEGGDHDELGKPCDVDMFLTVSEALELIENLSSAARRAHKNQVRS